MFIKIEKSIDKCILQWLKKAWGICVNKGCKTIRKFMFTKVEKA